MLKYGLLHKPSNELLKFYNRKHQDDTNTQFVLCLNGDHLWLVDDPVHAEWVRLNHTEWYNAGYETPMHGEYWKKKM